MMTSQRWLVTLLFGGPKTAAATSLCSSLGELPHRLGRASLVVHRRRSLFRLVRIAHDPWRLAFHTRLLFRCLSCTLSSDQQSQPSHSSQQLLGFAWASSATAASAAAAPVINRSAASTKIAILLLSAASFTA
jgi:hypothetical protein